MSISISNTLAAVPHFVDAGSSVSLKTRCHHPAAPARTDSTHGEKPAYPLYSMRKPAVATGSWPKAGHGSSPTYTPLELLN